MGDFVFPRDTQYALETYDVKALETLNMPAVGSPSFCTKQQSRNADCLIDGCFGEGTEIFINKDSRSKSNIQWGKKVFSQPPIVQVLPLKKMREACNFHHRYTSTMRDKIRKKNPENHILGFLKNLFANYGGK